MFWVSWGIVGVAGGVARTVGCSVGGGVVVVIACVCVAETLAVPESWVWLITLWAEVFVGAGGRHAPFPLCIVCKRESSRYLELRWPIGGC